MASLNRMDYARIYLWAEQVKVLTHRRQTQEVRQKIVQLCNRIQEKTEEVLGQMTVMDALLMLPAEEAVRPIDPVPQPSSEPSQGDPNV